MTTLARLLTHRPPREQPPVEAMARVAEANATFRHNVVVPRLQALQYRLEFLDLEAQQDVGFIDRDAERRRLAGQ